MTNRSEGWNGAMKRTTVQKIPLALFHSLSFLIYTAFILFAPFYIYILVALYFTLHIFICTCIICMFNYFITVDGDAVALYFDHSTHCASARLSATPYLSLSL